MSSENQKLDVCGCCEGIKALTPASVENRPGLTAIAYRVGTHASFKLTMKSSLSKQPALSKLTTRDDDDPSIALLDAWATVADGLTFYQERIANEGYLRTATERRSILELASLIGYELHPGVAASTYLAFMLDETPGAPPEATIGVGNKVQSVPGQDELPQVFETVEEIEAKVEWNALKPLLKKTHEFGRSTTRLYLKGTDTQLQPGDVILLVGEKREQNPSSKRWDFRILQSVTPDNKKDYTLVTWEEDLGHKIPSIEPADNPKVYAFRRRSALFGYNAPDWFAISGTLRKAYLMKAGKDTSNYDVDDPSTWGANWPSSIFKIQTVAINLIDLDAAYPGILKDSWIVLAKPNYVELYKAVEVDLDSRTDFSLTSKTTRIKLDTNKHLDWFGLRETVVFAQSEQIKLAKEPVTTPVFGDKIVIDRIKDDLDQGRTLIINGRRLKYIKVAERTHVAKVGEDEITEKEDKLFLVSANGPQPAALESGDVLKVEDSPEWTPQGFIKWHLTNEQGISGFVIAEPDDFEPEQEKEEDSSAAQLSLADENNCLVSEVVTLERAEENSEFTTLVLKTTLRNVYLRDTVSINANVANATHGETVNEILGSGDASQSFQRFTLRQPPLTYVSASTPSGTETTLEVRVNDLLWHEVPAFFGHGPDERIYVTQIDDEGKTTLLFGDGKTGARLPTGQENIKAKYRKGIGLSGLVKVNQLSQLMTRPLGVKGVTNPLAATGADDPEEREKARQNAPFTVLTLDRIVSLQDYEDFTRAFAGIGKVQATLLWNGERKMVHLTVAAADGGDVDETSDLYKNLIAGIDGARHQDQQVRVDSYQPITFNVKARVRVNSDYVVQDVLAVVSDALQEAFSFDMRNFGQAITPSEVLAVMQKVKGVVAVDLDELNGQDPFDKPNFRLLADIAHWDNNNENIEAAEMLTINPEGIVLTEMTI